ncbi:cell wall-binding repeat-containing protein [Kineococcus indalonis]|uniref:cell wall-binding repeat-containing protein n=1 Tax=Kineococcus indalonis TaxID=2696566 RepID=UPI00141271CF|nr:cell wall-binding repeat-containing protein [Kineococcus indalonis]NAZ86052.1 hypothetical protein [Kineococcus indalonis]
MRLAPRTLALAAALAAAVLGGAAAPAGAAPGDPLPDVQLKAAAVERVAGENRFATAARAAASFSGQGADAVVLARSDSYADSLAAAPLASDRNGPLLLTAPGSLNPVTADTIRDVLKPGGVVYLLGGTGALSPAVEQAVRALGFPVQRVQGANRYATAVEVAKLLPQASSVAVVTGKDFPDGLAAGALMGVIDGGTGRSVGAVLLSDGNALGADTSRYLAGRTFTTRIAVGGPAAIAVEQQGGWARFAGRNRYDTSAAVARLFTSSAFFTDATTVVGVATGADWADALSGSALMAFAGGPVLLTARDALPVETTQALQELQRDARAQGAEVTRALVFGGTGVVVAGVDAQVAGALS